jgi:hypothetical protein
MIHLSETQLIIALEHPCPQELLKDLQESIVRVLQAQYINPVETDEELCFANYTVMDLLLQLLNDKDGVTIRMLS